MKKNARLIVTLKCRRSCSYCCNNYKSLAQLRQPITDVSSLAQYDEVLITGGEPMQNPARTMRILQLLREQNSKQVVYLYTALYSLEVVAFLRLVDGIHYTLHAEADYLDIAGFERFQSHLYSSGAKKSHRLYVNPELVGYVPVNPRLWSRIEFKPWIDEAHCSLPPNEELFILPESYQA